MQIFFFFSNKLIVYFLIVEIFLYFIILLLAFFDHHDLIFLNFLLHMKKSIEIMKIFGVHFLINLQILRCPKRDLTIFGKCLYIYNANFVGTISQELIHITSTNFIFCQPFIKTGVGVHSIIGGAIMFYSIHFFYYEHYSYISVSIWHKYTKFYI